MKKVLCLTLALLMVLSLVGCGLEKTSTNGSTSTKTTVESVGSEENTGSFQTDSKEDEKNVTEWKKFLKEYEEWVDEYVSIMKKQKENPTDMSILTEYTAMLADVSKWAERSEGIAESIKGTDDAIEYSKEVLRIAGKLTQVSE